ncbi:MAG: HAMP domain-containing histidine kinase [Defluviitaleaceae bacterium]|nr:HAMP domain-containing histidine kinase [Defluviitaleaceae bacterium]
MRLKVFLSTYLLFLCVLFAIIGTVSVYMTRSQLVMLREKSTREYQTISASFARDIAALYSHHRGVGEGFAMGVDTLARGYAQYYSRHNIVIVLEDAPESAPSSNSGGALSFLRQEGGHFIHITGALPQPLDFFWLSYTLDITENIANMQSIQRILLGLAAGFSMAAALGLYFILLTIFKPLTAVAQASREIAGGHYSRRIHMTGKNELAAVATGFNQMAGEIESQIRMLKAEAMAKQQFIDNFAHEIRTPLTSIYGYAEYTQKAPMNEAAIVKSTQTIMDEAAHMQTIAESLLKLATLRNYTPEKVDIPVERLFEDVTQTLGVPLTCTCQVEFLHGQEDLIKSLTLNLCANAVKAYPPGQVGEICLTAAPAGDAVTLTVADKGCGIAAQDLAKITEPFYRVDKARCRSQGGVGLGLTLCKQIVEVHGAAMHVESAVGEGTTVTVTFTNP